MQLEGVIHDLEPVPGIHILYQPYNAKISF